MGRIGREGFIFDGQVQLLFFVLFLGRVHEITTLSLSLNTLTVDKTRFWTTYR